MTSPSRGVSNLTSWARSQRRPSSAHRSSDSGTCCRSTSPSGSSLRRSRPGCSPARDDRAPSRWSSWPARSSPARSGARLQGPGEHAVVEFGEGTEGDRHVRLLCGCRRTALRWFDRGGRCRPERHRLRPKRSEGPAGPGFCRARKAAGREESCVRQGWRAGRGCQVLRDIQAGSRAATREQLRDEAGVSPPLPTRAPACLRHLNATVETRRRDSTAAQTDAGFDGRSASVQLNQRAARAAKRSLWGDVSPALGTIASLRADDDNRHRPTRPRTSRARKARRIAAICSRSIVSQQVSTTRQPSASHQTINRSARPST